MKKILLFGLLTLFVSQVIAAPMYVRSSKAKVMKEPSFKAEMAYSAKKGDMINILDTRGNWYWIEHEANGEGWVSKFLVQSTPPRKKIVLSKKKEKKSRKVRRRASTLTTAASARGLTAEDSGGDGQIIADYESLEKMEGYDLREDDLSKFMEQLSQ